MWLKNFSLRKRSPVRESSKRGVSTEETAHKLEWRKKERTVTIQERQIVVKDESTLTVDNLVTLLFLKGLDRNNIVSLCKVNEKQVNI